MQWIPGSEQIFHGFVDPNLPKPLTKDIGFWALLDQGLRPGLPIGLDLTFPGDIKVPNYRRIYAIPDQDERTATPGLPSNPAMLTRGL